MDNSDNEDDAEELIVAEELLAAACQTHVPVDEATQKASKWSKHRTLLTESDATGGRAVGAREAATEGIRTERTYMRRPTSRKRLKFKGLHRQTDTPARYVQRNSVEPSVTKQAATLRATLAAMDEWSNGLNNNGKCNSKQTEFCQRVSK